MKAISLWQPWATLVVIGAKRIETRSYGTRHVGPLAIHATQTFPKAAQALCQTSPFKEALQAASYSSWQELPRGAVVGAVYLDKACRIPALPLGDTIEAEPFTACLCGHIRETHREGTGVCRCPTRWQGSMTPADQRVATGSFDGTTAVCACPAYRPWLSTTEAAFGDYRPGRWGWFLSDPRRLAEPVPFVGRQGFFHVPDRLLGRPGPQHLLSRRAGEHPRDDQGKFAIAGQAISQQGGSDAAQ